MKVWRGEFTGQYNYVMDKADATGDALAVDNWSDAIIEYTPGGDYLPRADEWQVALKYFIIDGRNIPFTHADDLLYLETQQKDVSGNPTGSKTKHYIPDLMSITQLLDQWVDQGWHMRFDAQSSLAISFSSSVFYWLDDRLKALFGLFTGHTDSDSAQRWTTTTNEGNRVISASCYPEILDDLQGFVVETTLRIAGEDTDLNSTDPVLAELLPNQVISYSAPLDDIPNGIEHTTAVSATWVPRQRYEYDPGMADLTWFDLEGAGPVRNFKVSMSYNTHFRGKKPVRLQYVTERFMCKLAFRKKPGVL